ncbi:MAG: hypothetical protein IKU93_02725 [Alistipes sp.]|nr:hypothetical protein [Alistipes sp.]
MKEIVAMEVFGTPYMTQAEELPINERGYWTRIAGVNASAEGLRGASAEERDALLKEVEELNAINE